MEIKGGSCKAGSIFTELGPYTAPSHLSRSYTAQPATASLLKPYGLGLSSMPLPSDGDAPLMDSSHGTTMTPGQYLRVLQRPTYYVN